jgi:hypothetical protein
MEVKEVTRPAIPIPNITKAETNGMNGGEELGGGSNGNFRDGEEIRETRTKGSTNAMERGANIL